MTFKLAIIGRPNVGKSTLFNRLAGKKLAIVDDTPGVTRDWRSAPASIADLKFEVVDTAGLEEAFDDSLEARMRRQTEQAFLEADLAILVYDARAGVTPLDKHFASWARKQKTPVVLVANKCDGSGSEMGLYEAYELGLGEPIPISAEHGVGMAGLYGLIKPFVDDYEEALRAEQERLAALAAKAKAEKQAAADDEFSDEEDQAFWEGDVDDASKPIQVAIVGRPNAGKSTLVNALIGQERVLTGPEAGMTRDAITVDWHYADRSFKLVDTAGMRRRAKIDDKVEKLSVGDGLRAVRLAQVVVLVTDANLMLDRQDITIAQHVINEGRCLVLAVNKWDDVKDREKALTKLRDRLDLSLSEVKGIPAVMISALKGHGLDKLMAGIMNVYDVWNKRIPTSGLNRWLFDVTEAHPPPLSNGRRIKIRYMAQVKSRPPTFAMWVSKPVDLPDNYRRYMLNNLREDFDLPGVPIRMMIRKGKNPYVKS